MARRTAEENRAAISAAARELFATLGFERATIRAIGERAGVDPAMVMRYFGSKDELFAQVVGLDIGAESLEPPADVEQLGEFVARNVLRIWEGDGTLVAILRSAVAHDRAAERLREVMGDQVVPLLVRAGVDPDQVRLRASLVATQVLGLVLVRMIGRAEPLASASPEDVVALVGPTFQRYLTGDLPELAPSATTP